MTVRLKYLDRIFLMGFLALAGLLFLGSIWLSKALERKAIDLVLRNVELTSASLTEGVSVDLGRGDYREAWRHLHSATTGTAIIAFQLVGQGDVDLVDDVDAAKRIESERQGMALIKGENPAVASATNDSLNRILVETGVRDRANDSPFHVTYLYSTDELPALVRYFRLLALTASATALLVSLLMFLSVRKRYLQALLQINDKITAIIRGKDPVVGSRDRLDDYFNSIESLRVFKDEFALVKSQLEEQVKVSALAEITQNLAHDLKNPLITFDFALRAKSWADFEELRPQIGRSLTTIHTIIGGMGKAGAPLTNRNEVMFDFTTTALDITRFFADRDVKIFHAGPTQVPAFLDTIAVERALTNLVRNAIEAGASDVSLRCTTRQNDLIFDISDNGPGVPNEALNSLFRRGSTHGKSGGSGIGLHNVQSIAKAHGGFVSHRRENSRTIFTICLPAAIVTSTAELVALEDLPPPKTDGSKLLKRQILVCLSNPGRQTELTQSLESDGIQVVNMDTKDLSPLIVYSDLDYITEKYAISQVRTVFDDPHRSIARVHRLISVIYKSMLTDGTHDET